MVHHPVYCFPMKRLEHRTSKLDEFLGGRRDLENYLKEGRCNRRVFVPPPPSSQMAGFPSPSCQHGIAYYIMRAVRRHTTSDRVGSWTTTSKPIHWIFEMLIIILMTVYLKYLDIYPSHKLVSYIQSNSSAKMCPFHSLLNLKVTITTQHSTEADAVNSVNFWRDEKWDVDSVGFKTFAFKT